MQSVLGISIDEVEHIDLVGVVLVRLYPLGELSDARRVI